MNQTLKSPICRECVEPAAADALPFAGLVCRRDQALEPCRATRQSGSPSAAWPPTAACIPSAWPRPSFEHGGQPSPGPYPLKFAALNDVSLEFFLREIIVHLKRDQKVIGECVAELAHVPAARSLAEEAYGNLRGHIELLEGVAAVTYRFLFCLMPREDSSSARNRYQRASIIMQVCAQ